MDGLAEAGPARFDEGCVVDEVVEMGARRKPPLAVIGLGLGGAVGGRAETRV